MHVYQHYIKCDLKFAADSVGWTKTGVLCVFFSPNIIISVLFKKCDVTFQFITDAKQIQGCPIISHKFQIFMYSVNTQLYTTIHNFLFILFDKYFRD